MTRPEYERLLTPAFRVGVDRQTDPDLLEEDLHALRHSLRMARSAFDRQVLVTKMQYIHDRLAELAAEEHENDV
jgi:methylphosphotriester-DNA--protein-cysteine methyltransferase